MKNVPRKDHWDTWAKQGSASGGLDQMVSEELFDHTWAASAYHLRRLLHIKACNRVLDAGCGWGRVIHALKYHDPSLVIDGYELTAEYVEKSRALLAREGLDKNVTIKQGDLTTIDLGQNRYDAFYSTRVIHYIDDKETVIQKLHECLRPNGRGLFVIPNRLCPYRWVSYNHAPLYPIRALGELMQRAGFRNIKYGGYGFLPGRLRLAHTSPACAIDRFFSQTPLGSFAGLAYVVGIR